MDEAKRDFSLDDITIRATPNYLANYVRVAYPIRDENGKIIWVDGGLQLPHSREDVTE